MIGIILKSGKLKTFKIECVIGITDDDKHGCSLIADHIQFHFVIRHAFSKLLNINGESLAPQEIKIDFAVLPVTKCQ